MPKPINLRDLTKLIIDSGRVDNADAAGHAESIIAGEYTLLELYDDADHWYRQPGTAWGYAHEVALLDGM